MAGIARKIVDLLCEDELTFQEAKLTLKQAEYILELERLKPKEKLPTQDQRAGSGETTGILNTDRLYIALRRLNRWEWDDLLGPKPEGFDDLPKWTEKKWWQFKRRKSKSDYISRPKRAIEKIVGEAVISRLWWVNELGRTEEQWFQWYTTGHFMGEETEDLQASR